MFSVSSQERRHAFPARRKKSERNEEQHDDSSQKKVGGHEKLQAQLRGNVHVRHAVTVAVLFVVVEILDDLLEHNATDVLEVTDPCLRFAEIACVL